jgi:hypothetical protein
MASLVLYLLAGAVAGEARPVALVPGSPDLEASVAGELAAGGSTTPSSATVAGRPFLLVAATTRTGEIIVGTSGRQLSEVRTTLIVGGARIEVSWPGASDP